VDEYEFKQEFLFDISNGHFSDAGIRFMLSKMKIIQPKTDPDEEEPTQVPVPPPVPVSVPKPSIHENEEDPIFDFTLFDDVIDEKPQEEEHVDIRHNLIRDLEQINEIVTMEPRCITVEPIEKKRDCIIL